MQLHVYGENLAAAAFALNARKDGFDTVLMNDKQVATQFSGIEYIQQRVDRGMVLVEPQRTLDLEENISLFHGQFRSNSLTYIHHVTSWMNNLGVQLEDVLVETLFRGQRYGDFFIADQLDALHGLTDQERQQAVFEINRNLTDDEFMHPKYKNDDNWYASRGYYQLAKATVGETISKIFFKPFLNKMHGEDFEKLIASEHRSAWVPFYYPESVIAWFKGHETNVEMKNFKYPQGQSFAGFIHMLEKYLDDNLEKRPDDFEEIWSSGNAKKSKDKKVYFGGPKRLSTIETFRTSLSLGRSVYMRGMAAASYTLFVVDETFNAFRLNQRPIGSEPGSYICVEFGAGASHLSSQNLIMESMKLCEYLGIMVFPEYSQVIDSRYPLRIEQSPSLLEDLEANRNLLFKKNFFGNPISEINGSINDQLCAALALNYQVKKESNFEL